MTRTSQQVPAAASGDCELLGVRAKPTESGRDAACAERLEDVEKFVRDSRAELDESSEYVFQLVMEALDQLDALKRQLAAAGIFESPEALRRARESM